MGRVTRFGLAIIVACGVVALTNPPSAGGNCSGTSTGHVPLTELSPALYQGYEGGLYPGGSNRLPAGHEQAADRLARLRLLDSTGHPDSVNGRIVFLSVGMSNTTQEYQRFMQIAVPDPQRNRAVVLVDGAQGGWSADRLADPAMNSSYWATVDSRLAAAGVTTAQVQAAWLKEADAGPTLAFPEDALKLHGEIETIIHDVRARFSNVRQIYLSSRIYAGYAASTLNPEPFAYQSGFTVKWLLQAQIEGAPGLNFDPARDAIVSPWLAWGPYLWGDGLVPRADGLVWECADFQTDGTHPSDSGRLKVANALLSFFKTDAVASRWFLDCAPSDPSVFAAPPRVLGLQVERDVSSDLLTWDDLDPVIGEGTFYDVVGGGLDDLLSSRDFSGARCLASGLPAASANVGPSDPPPGSAVYYLVRGRNVCGDGTYAEDWGDPGPRAALDTNSPCP